MQKIQSVFRFFYARRRAEEMNRQTPAILVYKIGLQIISETSKAFWKCETSVKKLRRDAKPDLYDWLLHRKMI